MNKWLIGLLATLAFSLAVPVWAAVCTDGVNCYCDRVQGGDLNDPNLLMCEDFEAVTLHDDTNFGGTSPLYGPWYDHTGLAGGRGFNSYWSRNYGAFSGGGWRLGQPAVPTVGVTCAFTLCWGGEWRADDRWQANSFAFLDLVRASEFDDELASMGSGPSNTSTGDSGIFDGQQTLAFRIPAGLGNSSGVAGKKVWGGGQKNFGITQAVAYPPNSITSGIWNHPWKHNEWVQGSFDFGDGIFLFHNASSIDDQDPFHNFIVYKAGTTNAQCDTAIAGATVRRGILSCPSVMRYKPDPAQGYYRRSRDFPLGKWACVRGHFTNLGTTNAGVKIWFNDTLIIDFDGLNDSLFKSSTGYDGLAWDSYANANGGGGGETPTVELTYRYEDNIHIRAGVPVSCAQIGVGASTPTSVTVRSIRIMEALLIVAGLALLYAAFGDSLRRYIPSRLHARGSSILHRTN